MVWEGPGPRFQLSSAAQLKLWVTDRAVIGLSLEQDCGASRRLIWRSGAPPVSRV